ncbi:MAG TPA: DNA adenine methylase [Gemmatales bacterium]|nr:DNA adenine methylase [Gemmatales bacterium]
MRYQSPLRYPGGKALLAGLLEDVLDLNNLRGVTYYEPFAGGAGAALVLLERNAVSELFLNDLDARVYAFWRASLNQTSKMIERTMNVPLSIKEWKRQKEICRLPSRHAQIDVAFAAFYMNRCNRSGVLTGAGPIGGMEQSGEWKLDERFYREELASRIAAIGRNRDRIHMSRLDAIDFLKSKLPSGRGRHGSFVYLDPPYVVKGQRLYLNAYDERAHGNLAKYMLNQHRTPWLMSYDDTDLIRGLYSANKIHRLSIDYKLHEKRTAEELIISPSWLSLPSVCRISGQPRQLVEI